MTKSSDVIYGRPLSIFLPVLPFGWASFTSKTTIRKCYQMLRTLLKITWFSSGIGCSHTIFIDSRIFFCNSFVRLRNSDIIHNRVCFPNMAVQWTERNKKFIFFNTQFAPTGERNKRLCSLMKKWPLGAVMYQNLVLLNATIPMKGGCHFG